MSRAAEPAVDASPRQKRRFSLALPLSVRSIDEGGLYYAEDTETVNLSGGGVCFVSRHKVEIGARLALEIAIPKAIRYHFGDKVIYRVRAVVIRVERPRDDGTRRIGARFLGEITG